MPESKGTWAQAARAHLKLHRTAEGTRQELLQKQGLAPKMQELTWVAGVPAKELNSEFCLPAHRTESRGVGMANSCLSSSILIPPKLTITFEYRWVLSDGDNFGNQRILGGHDQPGAAWSRRNQVPWAKRKSRMANRRHPALFE
jgi:hypothetical protein